MAPSLYYLAHGRRCAASTSGSTGNSSASLLPRSSPSLGSSAEERTVAELAALVALALLVVLALGYYLGGYLAHQRDVATSAAEREITTAAAH